MVRVGIEEEAPPATARERQEARIEREIIAIHREVALTTEPNTQIQFTPKQEERIIELARQLPPEKREKYVLYEEVPAPTPERKRVNMLEQAIRSPLSTQPLPPQAVKAIRETPITPTLMKFIEQIEHGPEQIAPFARPPPSIVEMQKMGEMGAEVPVGFVATFERYIRPDIPTPTTALLQPIFEGGRVTEAQYLAEHPGYALGGLAGEYAQAVTLSWLIGKTPLGKLERKVYEKVVGEKAQAWLTKQYVEKGPFEWKGIPEKIVMWVTGEKPYLAPQVVTVPGVETLSAKALQAQMGAWLLAETPRTSALVVSKMPGEKLASAWVKEHLYKVAMGGLSYALVEEQLKKTVEPKMPYLPREIVAPEKPRLLPVIIPFVSFKPAKEVMTAPLIEQVRVVTPKPIQIVKPQVTPISTVKQVPEIFQQPIVKVEPVSVQASVSTQVQQAAQVQQQIQKQLQQQVQIQKTALRQPTFLKAKAVPKFFELPTRRPRKRRGKPVGLVGRYKRAYPVASAKEMLRMVIGE